MDNPRVSIVAALGRNRELGVGNKLLWHIPEDLKRFKALTLGHPVVLGRKTFESIVAMLGKPLSNRINIVITRDPENYLNQESTVKKFFNDPVWGKQVIVVDSIEKALKEAKTTGVKESFIIGGAQIYEQSLPFVDRLYITLIDDGKEADSYFPNYENIFTKKISEEPHEHEGLKYKFVTLERGT